MALISCLTRPDGQQDVFSCLSVGQGLSGFLVLIILLVGWLVIQYLAEARRVRRTREARPGIPVPPAQFGNARHASAVHDFANQNYYQVMLAEMEKALFSAGYELTQDASRCTRLANADRRDISRKVTSVRHRYMTPLLSEQAMNDSIDDAMRNGSAVEWLNMLIWGSEREGWYITRSQDENSTRLTDWQKQMWPVRQVSIIVTSDTLVITRDLVRGLNEAVNRVSHTPFPENDNMPELSDVPVTSPGIQVTLERQLCTTPPGFFSEVAGRNVPEALTRMIAVPQDEEKRVVAVFAQITSPRSTEMLTLYLNAAAERISAGEAHGADYDDDNGYAFIVTRTLKPH